MTTYNGIPKGSYHTFCRKMYGIEQFEQNNKNKHFRNIRAGLPKSVQTQRVRKIDKFNTFQEYMSNFNDQNQQEKIKLNKISKTVEGRKGLSQNTRTYRIALRQQDQDNANNIQNQKKSRWRSKTERENKKSTKRQGANDMVGAFLPFFKIKLERDDGLVKQKRNFKIDNTKFRLKSLLIEQNKFITQKWFPIM